MKEYVVKQNGYYLQEKVDGAFRVLDMEQATKFLSLHSVKYFVTEDLGLNLANVTIIELETITTQKTMGICASCGELHVDLIPGVVCKETSVEYFCEDCHNNADLIIENQQLDLLDVE